MNYYLFIDESGTPDFSEVDKRSPIFTVCGVILSHENYLRFDENLIQIKKKYWSTDSIILHSSEIALKEGKFSIFKDPSIFSEFIREMNALIESSNFGILSASIRKDKFKPLKIPNVHRVYSMSLEYIIERTIHFLRGQDCKSCLRVVVECRGKKEDKILELEFNKLIKNGNRFWRPHEFEEFTPKIDFRTKKQNVNGLQLSDMCAYPIAKHLLDPKRSHPTFPYIDPKIYCVDGNCSSYGLKVFP